MRRICLDTSGYSHFKHNDPQVVRIVSEAREVGLPVIALGELGAGFLRGSRQRENERELRRFLSYPVVRVLVVDEEGASLYAQIVQELREAGTPIPTNDIWIGALAAREGATVVTYDHHFEHIRRVGSVILD